MTILYPQDVHDSISSCKIHYVYVFSDHKPISIALDTSILPQNVENHNANHHHKINWNCLKDCEIFFYKCVSGEMLHMIDLTCDKEVLQCCDPNCNSLNHRSAIDFMYDKIINSLITAEKLSFVSKDKKFNHVPGWNELVAEAHDASRDA